MAKIEALTKQQSEVQTKAERLRRQAETKRQRLAAIESKRKELAVAAHVEEDPKAKKQLGSLARERDDIREELSTIEGVIGELEAKLCQIGNEMAREEQKAFRERIEERFELQAKEAKAVEKSVEKLEGELKQLLARDFEIVAMLGNLKLEPEHKERCRRQLYGNKETRINSVILALNRALRPEITPVPNGMSDVLDLEANERAAEELVLLVVGDTPLTTKQETKPRRQYEALQRISGLQRHELKPGDKVWLNPKDSDLEQLMTAGAIREVPNSAQAAQQ